MGYHLKQSQTAQPLMFLMIDSTDHLAGKTGLSPTVTLSKNGGSFASPAGAVTELANGWYKVAGNATDSATLGPLLLHATGSGADPCDERYDVVAFDPQATSLGLSLAKTTNLTGFNDIAASAIVSGGAITTSSGAVSTVTTVGSVTGAVGSVTGSIGSLATQAKLDVNAEVDTALSDYDAPTNAEMTARTLAAGSYATAANQTTILSKTNLIPASPAAVGSAMTLDLTQDLADTKDATVGGALHGAWTGTWGKAVKNVAAKTMKLFGIGSQSVAAITYTLDDGENPTSRTPQ